jgi:MFS family permease
MYHSCSAIVAEDELVHLSAALTLFLATTDAVCSPHNIYLVSVLTRTYYSQKTIVSTSLPTIASDLGATQSQYTWVGVAYMLTQTACQPLYGRISDLVGRKVRRHSLPATVVFIIRFRTFYTRV